MTRTLAIRTAFVLSGMAGLVYEVLWTRYLGLFVGHGAYAQVLVLAVYLGGMAVGSFAIADISKRLVAPLRAYAAAEAVLAVFGLAFHALFVLATEFSYDVLFPAVGSAGMVGSIRWAVAGSLILPQAVVLGATFPLMAAGLVRADVGHPGRSVAVAYLLNTMGGAAGVLIAGFVLIGRLGLPGTSVVAAILNLAAAGLVWRETRRSDQGMPPASEPAAAPGPLATEPPPVGQSAAREDAQDVWSERVAAGTPSTAALTPMLLVVSFGTALASFAYEIGWIRMLSLVLGSATHAFELMLSAFIFGIAVGAWSIRKRADRTQDPVRLLGFVQVGMGLAALLSLPLYLLTFQAMASMVQSLSSTDIGYAAFNVGRYGLCLLVMLPSTILAGMTLPLITGALLRGGAGERAIGRVYGTNTIGSVVGAGAAGLFLLPRLGLEGLIVAGAGLDMVLGLWLLIRAGQWAAAGTRTALMTGGVSAILVVLVVSVVDLNPTFLTSGVYRRGDLSVAAESRSLFYQDGRTATVSAHVGTSDGVIVLATNGKPDASLGPRWIMEGRDTLPERPIPQGRDYTTQVLGPALALAHRPGATSVANIGHGSGMTATSFLTSPSVDRVVTIEIEPLMVEGSLVFLPANGPAFADPRASYVFDDAKSFFSYRRERFDIIFAEPSNPWVSGTASLFTREFYARILDSMGEGAVLTQWMQLYELNDDLFLSVLAALDAVFPSYRGYLIGGSDVAIVALAEGSLNEPDWSVVERESFRTLTQSAPPVLAQHMEALFMFDEQTFRAILDGGVPVNSDYHPLLDQGAERARFDQSAAYGAYSFAVSRVDLAGHLAGRLRRPSSYAIPPAYGLEATVLAERAAWLREALEEGGGIAPEEFPEWQNELVYLQEFLSVTDTGSGFGSWDAWAASFVYAEGLLHSGTSGFIDDRFYERVDRLIARGEAPAEASAVVELFRSLGTGEWLPVSEAADMLVARVAAGEGWMPPDLLMDAAVLGYLETGRPDAARNAVDLLAPRTGRLEGDLRTRLLRALATLGEPSAR